jgi:mono/diheme cytochrome c family protein
MPVFGAPVATAAEDLAKADGIWPDSDVQQPQSTDRAVSAGRELAGVTAYNCISCHAFADRPLAGSAGPNMVNFAERLRYDWWNRYMHNPARFKPGTRMTGFFLRNDGLANNTEILDGDPQAQSDALWAYLNLGELFMPAPEGVPTGGGLELMVGDQPRVFRTFLRNAGSRGIAVGFPSGVHFAFDANTCRLAEVWRGKFLDASGAWAGRGGQVTGGQGPSVWEGAEGATAIPVPAADPGSPGGQADVDPRFRGYLLDDAGTPTFRYTAGPAGAADEWRLSFEDRFEPADDPGTLFRRSITINGLTQDRAVWLCIGPGDADILETGGALVASELTRDGSQWILLTDPEGRTRGSATVIVEVKQ